MYCLFNYVSFIGVSFHEIESLSLDALTVIYLELLSLNRRRILFYLTSKYTATNVSIARQRLGKYISEVTLSTIGQWTNKHAFLTREDGVFRDVRSEEL
jgi:hypothetical protein